MNIEWIMIELIMLAMVMLFNANIGNIFFENQKVSQKFVTIMKVQIECCELQVMAELVV
jgi:hypothetical protein